MRQSVTAWAPLSSDEYSSCMGTYAWKLIPAVLITGSGVLLFAFRLPLAGYPTLIAGILVAFAVDRRLFRDLLALGVGIAIMSVVPITTDIGLSHMVVMGAAMILAIALPFLLNRFVFRDNAITFPFRRGTKWSRTEKVYLPSVLVLGYLILPVYLIGSGVYVNWPAVSTPGEVGLLFLGTNALGIWDELFFICTAFALLRRHFPIVVANVLQATLFTSFLYELGFTGWGPLLIFPFAMIQGFIFQQTKSLAYVITVHLLFDLVLFLVLVHAHNPGFLPIFLY
jgi:membrane protease YdiL (CAAX protease family)